MSKVSIIGTGFVGASSAFAIALGGVCSDLLLVDLNTDRAKAEALDISHAAATTSGVRVHSGGYADIVDSQIVVVAAGVNQKAGESRLDLLSRNAAIFNSIIPEIVRFAPNSVVLITTNPVDIMTGVSRLLHSNPELVMGTGTILDTARFRDLISRETGVSAMHIHANVLGEHGDSSVLAWDSARVAGLPIHDFFASMNKEFTPELATQIERKVRGAAGTIIAGKSATYYGIGAAVMKIVDAILNDSRIVMTASGLSAYGICLSLPAVVGNHGIANFLYPKLSDDELEKLHYSAKILLETQSAIIKDGKLTV